VKTFAWAFGFGLVFIVINPPLQAPDEPEHFERMHAISQGLLWRDSTLGGQPLDRDVIDLTRGSYSKLSLQRERRISARETIALLFASQDTSPVTADMLPYVSPAPYVLGAIVVGGVRGCGGSALAALYAVRILHLFVYLLVCALALRLMPHAKDSLRLLVLSPAPLYLAGAAIPEAWLCGSAFVLIALVYALLAGTLSDASRTLTLGAFSAAMLAVIKPPYVLLNALVLPLRKWRPVLVIFVVPTLIAAGWNVLILTSISQTLPQMRVEANISLSEQALFMREHPMQALAVLVHALRPVWVHHAIGVFGWMDSALPPALTFSLLLLMVLAAWLSPDAPPTRLTAWVSLALAAGLSLAVSALLYMSFTSVGGPRVEGLQGRYFVPFFPLVFAAISALPKPTTAAWPRRVVPYALSLAWLATVATLIGRYY
jgi:uncharacterized membrane protein